MTLRTIHKSKLDIAERQILKVDGDLLRFLNVAWQYDPVINYQALFVWYEIALHADEETEVDIYRIRTRQSLPSGAQVYIGTAQQESDFWGHSERHVYYGQIRQSRKASDE